MTAIWAQNLLNLQNLDQEILNLKARILMIPKETAKLQAEIDKIENAVKEANNLKSAHERELKQTEAEIAELNDKIGKLQTQSSLVKKNTEYQAMLGTIALHKKAISELESRQIALMDELEADTLRIRDAQIKVQQETAGFREEIKEFEELTLDIKRRGAMLLKKRPELRSMVDSELLTRYEMILKKNAGTPLVCVDADKCGHCHLRLTPQTLASARSGAVTLCDNCMHIIYFDDNAEE